MLARTRIPRSLSCTALRSLVVQISSACYLADAVGLRTWIWFSKATGGIMRRIDVLATRCLELAAPGKSNLVDATVAEAAIRDCAEALL